MTRARTPNRVEVLGLGNIVVDHLVTLAAPLQPDTKHLIGTDQLQVGGPVPTALVLLSRWGLRTAFIGAWSDDAHGRLIEEDLAREGVDLTLAVRAVNGRTGFAHVWIDPHQATRTIAYRHAEAAWADGPAGRFPHPPPRLLHLDGWPQEPAMAWANAMHENGGLVSLDTGSVKPGIEALLRRVDLLNVSIRFVHDFLDIDDAEAAARQLHAMGPRWVTVTAGCEGAWLAAGNGVTHCPAFPVDAVDTTGAGDVFAGAMLYGFLAAWSPEAALRMAGAAAALKCTRLGNRDALPDLDAARRLAGWGTKRNGAGRLQQTGAE